MRLNIFYKILVLVVWALCHYFWGDKPDAVSYFRDMYMVLWVLVSIHLAEWFLSIFRA